MKKIFIAATKQNDGKTTVALGLISNLQKHFKKIGFIKPVGQRYLEEDGLKVDEDSILIEESLKLYGIKAKLKDMSPVAVEKGFTEKYIANPERKNITRQIKYAFKRVSKKEDLVVIEGTGHAGVGSVFDHSNAVVAKLLGSKVIMISSGGIGRPIDEIILNKALFDREGVKLLGVIVNKVIPEKFGKINNLIRKGLRRKGIKVLGVVPYNPVLSCPTVRQLLEETEYELLFECADTALDNHVSKVVIGAMQVKDAVKYITGHSLMITPGDREDMIKLALELSGKGCKIAGIVLTGDLMPSDEVIEQTKAASIPVLLARSDTYAAAAIVHDLTVKIRPADREKIEIVKKIIHDYVDLDMITKGL
ncbi:MAG: AAA family ATPase [Candidatus Omnitrophica bacterium]|nr:AAA family ATPase [Candidatus Omnitrophota bacterium]MDD5592036.1 AAA family ATPase [Candidatus Omnitrophota bacterium]